MAGNWIKMRHDLATDPAVIATADRLGISEAHVVGLLHRLWSWADQHTENGDAAGVTLSWIERHVGVTGFAEMLVRVGWIEATDDGVRIVNFERHMGKSAKKRALAAERMQRLRDATSVTKTSPEKRREEKNTNTPNGVLGSRRPKLGPASRRKPPDVTLTDELRAYAMGVGLEPAAVDGEWAKFSDHEFRDPKRDWAAAWRRWARQAVEWRQERNGRPTATGSDPNRTKAIAEAAERREREDEEYLRLVKAGKAKL